MAFWHGFSVTGRFTMLVILCFSASISLAQGQDRSTNQNPAVGSANPVNANQGYYRQATESQKNPYITQPQKGTASNQNRQGFNHQNGNRQPVSKAQNQRQNLRQKQPPLNQNRVHTLQPKKRTVNRLLPKPFVLNAQEQQYIDQILLAWEKRSDKVNKFECIFKRWEYDKDFGAKDKQNQDIAISISEGDIKYYNPDKGLFKVNQTYIWNRRSNNYQKKPSPINEHWVTDGLSVFEFNGLMKQIVQRKLPPELQGKAIIDGPLPFLFGAKADKLKKRFYMRERTDPRYRDQEIWLEAYPRTQRDFANFRQIQLIMTRKNFMPYAMRIYLPDGKKYTVYEFKKQLINGIFLGKGTFKKPSTPRGWKLIIEKPPVASRSTRNLRK